MRGPSKLLVVEDDPDVRAALVEFLFLEGFEVAEAAHGLAALELLQTGYRPDAILLDLSMPVMDGRAFHRALQTNPAWAALPIIVIAAVPDYAPIGIEALLPKPFEVERLLQVVANVTRRPYGGCSVLVVEDDSDIRESMLEVLGDSGLEVHGAAHGREALALLNAGLQPSAIVTDLMMPVMTGWELLARLGTNPAWADIPVIVISASTSSPSGGALAGVLPKPVDHATLLALLHRICSRNRPDA